MEKIGKSKENGHTHYKINNYISSKKLFLSYWKGVKIADFYVSLPINQF